MRLCLACREPFVGGLWECPHCGHQTADVAGVPSFAPELSSDTGFKDSHFAELVRLEERNFWFRARNALLVWSLRKYFPGARSFFEVGCGTGFVLAGVAAAIPGLQLYGSEISSIGMAHALKRVAGATFLQMDARSIPYVDEFDVIGAFDVLEHIAEDTSVLGEMFRSVRKGGGIILTVPQHQFLWSTTDEYACHIRRYEAGEIAEKVRAAGFEVERMTSFVSLLLPLMFASRFRQNRRTPEHDPLTELRIGGFVNSALETIMTVERWAIRRGVDFPAGGSLLVVARKPN
jgi:SAM-dependent methyltransferase